MAVKPVRKRTRSSKPLPADQTRIPAGSVEVTDQDVMPYMRDCIRRIGGYSLEQRAVIDYRDGLKPVHRRVLWAAFNQGLTAAKVMTRKGAYIVGETMGKYHPHGDTSIYDALVGMTWTPNQLIFGMGNYGSLLDNAAAMRYTEARLSAYTDEVMFSYSEVLETVLNYDGKERDALYLPATLPNLLLNGAFGIAFGTTVGIPAFAKAGVLRLAKQAVSGTAVSVRDCMRHLEPVAEEGGKAWFGDDGKDKEKLAELERFFETGQGSVYWEPRFEMDVEKRQVFIDGYAPGVAISLQTSLNQLSTKAIADDILSAADEQDIDEESGRTHHRWRITLKKSVPAEEVEQALYEVIDCFSATQRLNFALNDRKVSALDESDVDFFPSNMPEFFRKWGEYRVDLERRLIDNHLAAEGVRLARSELLLFAAINKKTIILALDQRDTEAYLVKQLKRPLEYVNQLLDLPVRRLKKLEEASYRERIRVSQGIIKGLQADHKNPVTRIHANMDAAARLAV